MNIGIKVIEEAIDDRQEVIRSYARKLKETSDELKRVQRVIKECQEEIAELLKLRTKLEEEK